ncbi:hypothetical protein Tco_1486666 [Tanacetum coccineum]
MGRSHIWHRLYRIPVYVPLVAPVQTSPSPKWSYSSLPVSPSSPVVPSLVASPVNTPTATISVDEDQFLEGYDRDLRELYTSAIWTPILALEEWAGQTDTQRAALWHAIYDIQRENHDLRRQLAEERRE